MITVWFDGVTHVPRRHASRSTHRLAALLLLLHDLLEPEPAGLDALRRALLVAFCHKFLGNSVIFVALLLEIDDELVFRVVIGFCCLCRRLLAGLLLRLTLSGSGGILFVLR